MKKRIKKKKNKRRTKKYEKTSRRKQWRKSNLELNKAIQEKDYEKIKEVADDIQQLADSRPHVQESTSRSYNVLGKRVENSYQAYLRNREKWIDKGYSMDDALTFEEYRDYYDLATKRGTPNIAATFAKEDRSYTVTLARNIINYARDNDIDLGEYSSVRDIIGIDKRSTLFNELVIEKAILTREEFEAMY